MKCAKCGQTGSFYKGRRTCKKCLFEYYYAWRKRNPEKYRISHQKTADKRKDKQKEYYKAWYAKNGRKRNRQQMAAHNLVGYAVETGRLIKPTHCPTCGRIDRIEAHHEDYLKPLEVMWFCNRCHRNKHKGNVVKS